MSANKIVLAFSGGLDTSFCVLELKKRGFEVHTVFVDTGGVSDEERQYIEQRANALGTDQHYTLDASADLWNEFVIPLAWSHARMLDQYPMLCSDRYVIVKKCLELCDKLGTKQFAHGCTGMGNDQLRFDQTVRSLGDYEIVAPIRELQAKTKQVREYEMDFLRAAGHEVRTSTSLYSINENILGVTISGGQIDEFGPPAEDTRKLCLPREQWPAEKCRLKIEFQQGIAVAIDGETSSGPEFLTRLNREFGAYGVGRHIYTGDVSIGIKGRIVFECPGLTALLTAHRALEDCVNTKWQNQFRHHVAHRWAELVYTGFFYEPHKFDLEAYLKSSQKYVTGTVTIESDGGLVHATAIDSPHILRDAESVYAQSCNWTPDEAVGFIKLIGQSSSLSAKINGVAGQ